MTTGYTDSDDSGWTFDLIDWKYTKNSQYNQNNGGMTLTTVTPTLGADGWPRMAGWSASGPGDDGPWVACRDGATSATCSLRAFYDPDDTTHPEYRQSAHRNVENMMIREDTVDENATTTTTYVVNSEKYRYSYDEATNSMKPHTAAPACPQSTKRFFPFNTLKDGCTQPLTSHQNNDPYPLDYFFGLHGRMDLKPDAQGLTASGAHQTFHFKGDDNLFLYIDGVTIIDLGGWRGATPANLDLNTGEVNVGPMVATNGGVPIQNGSTRTNRFDKAQTDSTSLYAAYHNALGNAGVDKYLTRGEDGVWRLKADMTHKVDLFYSDTDSVASSIQISTTFTDVPRYPLAYNRNGAQTGVTPKQR